MMHVRLYSFVGRLAVAIIVFACVVFSPVALAATCNDLGGSCSASVLDCTTDGGTTNASASDCSGSQVCCVKLCAPPGTCTDAASCTGTASPAGDCGNNKICCQPAPAKAGTACGSGGLVCVATANCASGKGTTGNQACKSGEVCCSEVLASGSAVAGNATVGVAGSPTVLEDPLGGVGLIGLLSRLIQTFLGLVGAIALLVFVYAGVMYITAGSSDRIKKAVDAMKYAVLGLMIIMFSYMVTSFYISILTQGPAAPVAQKSGAQPPAQPGG